MDRSLPFTEKHLGWLKQMQEAGWHLLQLIDDVLDLSRVEAGAVTLTNAPLYLPSLLASAIAMVESDAQKRGIRVDKHLSCDHPVNVLADVTRLRQVLINLLSNAIKYNRPGGSVSIQTRCETPGRVTIDISDTGLGMSAAQLPRLFKPFDRLGRENSNVPGAGIGLYITKLLVERMHGEVQVRSQGGQGTTFSITLPTTDDPTQQPAATVDDDKQVHAYRARKVLLIEDNGNNVDVISAMVALRPQISLEVSRNGLSGLTASKLRQPDLVLLDLRLPDISGIAVLEGMRSDPATRDVPVIVLSASADQAQVSEAMRLGAQAFLPKPIVTRQFLNLLDDVLSNVATDLGELH
jgi:CheY-like chemotaxis protein